MSLAPSTRASRCGCLQVSNSIYGSRTLARLGDVSPDADISSALLGKNMDDWWTVLRSGMWRLYFQLSAEGRERYYNEMLPLLHHTKTEVLGERDDNAYYLVYLGTKPHARGRGYARKLLQTMIERVCLLLARVFFRSCFGHQKTNIPFALPFPSLDRLMQRIGLFTLSRAPWPTTPTTKSLALLSRRISSSSVDLSSSCQSWSVSPSRPLPGALMSQPSPLAPLAWSSPRPVPPSRCCRWLGRPESLKSSPLSQVCVCAVSQPDRAFSLFLDNVCVSVCVCGVR